MDFTNLQMTLTVMVIITAVAVAVFFDHLRRQHQLQQPRRIKPLTISRPQPSARMFDTSPLDHTPAKKAAAESPLETPVAIATSSRSPVQPRAERETPLPPFTIDAALWERLIASHDDSRYVAPTKHYSGMIQPPVLEHLLKSEEPFTGLVVSIGINDSDSSMWHSQGLMQSVGTYIATLLSENDFSCRTAYDEFVMVCPGRRGAQSQVHLNDISQRLWDFQLRGIGACSILFSWGGVQVQDQPLAEAVSSATERMRETKRSGHSAKSAERIERRSSSVF